jgi:hypothetical protein
MAEVANRALPEGGGDCPADGRITGARWSDAGGGGTGQAAATLTTMRRAQWRRENSGIGGPVATEPKVRFRFFDWLLQAEFDPIRQSPGRATSNPVRRM